MKGIVRYAVRLAAAAPLLVPPAGCVGEDSGGCAPAEERRLVAVKVVDGITGRDITENGEAGGADIYLFSADGRFAEHFYVDAEQVAHHVPIEISASEMGRCNVSVWTNAGDGQTLHVPDGESDMGARAVSLISGGDEYHGSPDNLFFGTARLAASGGGEPEEVVVMRKNARMRITARGLGGDVPEERYYFTVRAPNDGYDFGGNPVSGEATIRRTGAFDTNGDLSTPEAFNMIHTDGEETGAVTVRLFESAAGRAADRLVAETSSYDDGKPISLPAGRTVNLLIDLGGSAGITVKMELTAWNETYQWETW